MKRLAQRDYDEFEEFQADSRWMESKTAKKHVEEELGEEGE